MPDATRSDPGPLARSYLKGSRGVFIPLAAIRLIGDPASALLFGQLLWLTTQADHAKLVTRAGQQWLARPYGGWEDDCGLSAKQARSAIAKLGETGLVEVRRWKRDGAPTTHLRVVWEALESGLAGQMEMPDPADGSGQEGSSLDLADRADPPLSETEETTTETTTGSLTLASQNGHRVPTFADCWNIYPRKLARKKAEKAWTARVRSGVDPQALYDATVHYARHRAGQDQSYTMHGSTFYGPDDRWLDFLDPSTAAPPVKQAQPRESAAMSKGRRAAEAAARLRSEPRGELTA